ncbi:TNF receptor-associated factor 6-like isoform X1 [Biomphalaria glabrata]|nr:TNF receptor-associated factor 6-like isoform X1 [Biomphalaria glabrata]
MEMATNSQDHGYDVQPLCEIEPRHICPICLMIMKNAVQTMCGHRFCEACINKVVTRGSTLLTCPVDKTVSRVDQIFQDVATRREILCLPIQCPNKSGGCSWEGDLIDLTGHKSSCGLEPVTCAHGCGASLVRTEADEHLSVCPFRQMNCLFCNECVQQSAMISHTEQCPMAPVTCSLCGEDDLVRKALPEHQDIETGNCPNVVVPCPYKYTGCEFQAERIKIQEHINESGTLSIHMELVAKKLAEQCSVVQDMQEKLNGAIRQTNEAVSLVVATQKSQTQMTKDLRDRNVTGRLHWKVKVGHQRATRTSYCSPTFYTGCPGYKVQLTLNMDGQKDGHVKYTSISMSLLPGEYDDDMIFPFNATCFVTLYDQANSPTRQANVTHDIIMREVPRNYSRHGRQVERVFKRENNKFVKRQDLLGPDSRYLKQGLLHMEVCVIHSFYPPLDLVPASAACFNSFVGHGSFVLHSPQSPQMPASPMTPPIVGVTRLAISN